MPRVRQIYQTDAVYVGPTGSFPATGKHFTNDIYGSTVNAYGSLSGNNMVAQLSRIQSANYSFNKTLKDVNQFDELAAIDRLPIDPPTVNASLSWLVSNMTNEKLVGFLVNVPGDGAQVSAISGFLNQTTDPKNYFVCSAPEGNDLANFGTTSNANTQFVIGIGNASLSSYRAEGSVGNFPTVTVNLEGLNMKGDNNSSGRYIPAVNPTDGTAITGFAYALPQATQNFLSKTINQDSQSLSVLRPGDVQFNIGLNSGDGFFIESDLKVQSYSFDFNLTRQNLNKLGSKFAFAKVIQFPVQCTLNITADAGDFMTGSLPEIINNNTTFNPRVSIIQNGTTANSAGVGVKVVDYQLRGAKLDSQSITSSIGPNKSVSMTFTAQLGGPNQSNVGFFMSGVASNLP